MSHLPRLHRLCPQFNCLERLSLVTSLSSFEHGYHCADSELWTIFVDFLAQSGADQPLHTLTVTILDSNDHVSGFGLCWCQRQVPITQNCPWQELSTHPEWRRFGEAARKRRNLRTLELVVGEYICSMPPAQIRDIICPVDSPFSSLLRGGILSLSRGGNRQCGWFLSDTVLR